MIKINTCITFYFSVPRSTQSLTLLGDPLEVVEAGRGEMIAEIGTSGLTYPLNKMNTNVGFHKKSNFFDNVEY